MKAGHEASVAALDAALGTLRPGVLAREVHAAGQAELDRHGFGELFDHRMGYGIGVEFLTWIERGGLSLDAGFIDGQINLEPVVDTAFLRGDCNTDLRVDIADGVWILNNMFQSGPAGTCAEACDADNNGALEMGNAIYVITYRLLSGPAPIAPFPECGIEAGADCVTSACP